MVDQMPTGRAVRPRSKFRPFHFVLVFLVGLLLGWLVIGWIVWPVQWIDAVPANLRLDDQRQFVILVAEEYAQTGNAALAQERLASWDEDSLTMLVALMEQQAVDEATAVALADLRQALLIPQTELSFWDTILEQKLIVVSAILGGLVLLTAVALAVYPSIRRNQRRQARLRQLETEEEALLQAAREENPAVATAPVLPEEPAAEESTAVPAQPIPSAPASPPAQPQPQQADPQQATAPPNEAQNGQNQAQVARAAKPNEAQPAEKPEEQAPTPANPPQPAPPVPAPQPQQIEEEDEEEVANSLMDILTSVFEDDDESAHFESLLKGLGDINVMKLVKEADHIAQQLRERRPKVKTAVSAPIR